MCARQAFSDPREVALTPTIEHRLLRACARAHRLLESALADRTREVCRSPGSRHVRRTASISNVGGNRTDGVGEDQECTHFADTSGSVEFAPNSNSFGIEQREGNAVDGSGDRKSGTTIFPWNDARGIRLEDRRRANTRSASSRVFFFSRPPCDGFDRPASQWLAGSLIGFRRS